MGIMAESQSKNVTFSRMKRRSASSWRRSLGRGAGLPAGAAPLHDLGAVEARQLAEAVIAVDHGPLHDLGVAYEEAGLWGGAGQGQAALRTAPGSGQRSRTRTFAQRPQTGSSN